MKAVAGLAFCIRKQASRVTSLASSLVASHSYRATLFLFTEKLSREKCVRDDFAKETAEKRENKHGTFLVKPYVRPPRHPKFIIQSISSFLKLSIASLSWFLIEPKSTCWSSSCLSWVLNPSAILTKFSIISFIGICPPNSCGKIFASKCPKILSKSL